MDSSKRSSRKSLQATWTYNKGESRIIRNSVATQALARTYTFGIRVGQSLVDLIPPRNLGTNYLLVKVLERTKSFIVHVLEGFKMQDHSERHQTTEGGGGTYDIDFLRMRKSRETLELFDLVGSSFHGGQETETHVLELVQHRIVPFWRRLTLAFRRHRRALFLWRNSRIQASVNSHVVHDVVVRSRLR